MTKGYVVNNIALPIDASSEEAFCVAKDRLAVLNIFPQDDSYAIYRKSIDARRKDDIKFVYSVLVTGELPTVDESKLASARISRYTQGTLNVSEGTKSLKGRALVVGSGPCGLFSALLLAERGYKPIIIERGGSIEERKREVEKFRLTRILNTNTNIQFGAGGAGTFSDGKLVTRIADPLSDYVMTRLVEFGAPSEIKYLAKPHVGTDVLSVVVNNVLRRIQELGGEIRFNTTLIDFKEKLGEITAAVTDKGIIPCSLIILAIGHSSRDTYSMLISKGADIVAKPFSVGMRIEHPSELIDKAMYGDFAGHPSLGHAEYNLSYNTKVRGAYTFCMCPGGEVVAATSEEYGVVTNGMSYHARDGEYSNSAVLSSVFKEDYGATPMSAIDYQRNIERLAFIAGGSDYSAPYTTVGDFLSSSYKNRYTTVVPSYMHGAVRLADPEAYLPRTVTDNLRRAICDFDKKIKGFASPYATLTGAETRTSAPIRIIRDVITRLATGYTNLYPAGEGAGYAGGITSAAIDGINTALEIISRYKPY